MSSSSSRRIPVRIRPSRVSKASAPKPCSSELQQLLGCWKQNAVDAAVCTVLGTQLRTCLAQIEPSQKQDYSKLNYYLHRVIQNRM
jgi:hypothetical protein